TPHSMPRHPQSFPTRRSSDLSAALPKRALSQRRKDAESAKERNMPQSSALLGELCDFAPWREMSFSWQTDLDCRFFVVRVDSVPDRKSTRLNSSHSQISYAVF